LNILHACPIPPIAHNSTTNAIQRPRHDKAHNRTRKKTREQLCPLSRIPRDERKPPHMANEMKNKQPDTLAKSKREQKPEHRLLQRKRNVKWGGDYHWTKAKSEQKGMVERKSYMTQGH
jgi:hypothetical protein